MADFAGLAAVIAFVVALLMHLAGWGSGKLDVTTFWLIGFLGLAVFLFWEPAKARLRRGA